MHLAAPLVYRFIFICSLSPRESKYQHVTLDMFGGDFGQFVRIEIVSFFFLLSFPSQYGLLFSSSYIFFLRCIYDSSTTLVSPHGEIPKPLKLLLSHGRTSL